MQTQIERDQLTENQYVAMGQLMQKSSSLDVDCGVFDYNITPTTPLALKDPGYTYCQNLFIDNYKKCDNTGVRGSIQAGCLVYDLKAKHD